MKVQINKELLPMKAHYFLFNAGTAPVVPFMPTLARQLGFSSVVVGTMYSILPIIGMLAKPLFGFIGDRYQNHRMLFLIAEILTAVSFFMIMFIPAIPQSAPIVAYECNGGVSNISFCSEMDECILNNLKKRFDNQTLECQLHCEIDMCKNALNRNICANNTNVYLDFTTFLHMNDANIDQNQCLVFNAQENNDQNVTLLCPNNNESFSTNCAINCNNEMFIKTLTESSEPTNIKAFELYQFWLFFGMLILSWIGMAVVVSIGDAICFSILGERHHLYGKQRLCGSIGWGIFSIIAGVLVDEMSKGSATKDYTIAFCMTAVIISFDVFASSKLKPRQSHLSTSIIKDIGAMLLSVQCIMFFLWCISIGLCTALIWNFLFWYLEDLNAQTNGCENSMKTLEGFAMGIQCFGGELPFFFLSGWLLKKIGHVNAMSLVLFAFGVRFLLYSVIQNPWYVLPIELLNGVTFGIFYATMASYASIVAPPGTEATMQGLVGAIFEGIGVSLGSLIGGILFKEIGGGRTFQLFGIGAFVVFFIHVLIQMMLPKPRIGKAVANDEF